MHAQLLIERECGFAGCIDNVLRDGKGSFRPIPAAATKEEQDDVHPLGVDPG